MKKWYLSKGVIGGLVSLLSVIAINWGFDINEDTQGLITNNILEITAIIGSVFAIYGRVTATENLTEKDLRITSILKKSWDLKKAIDENKEK